MKSIRKILNSNTNKIALLTKQALLNQFYTNIVKKYLPEPLNQNIEVSNFESGILTLATAYNEILLLLKHQIPDLIPVLRQNSTFAGLISIKAQVNPNLASVTKDVLKQPRAILSNAAKASLLTSAAKVSYNKLKQALEKLAAKATK